jgi:hypothetical protein
MTLGLAKTRAARSWRLERDRPNHKVRPSDKIAELVSKDEELTPSTGRGAFERQSRVGPSSEPDVRVSADPIGREVDLQEIGGQRRIAGAATYVAR